MSKRELSEFQLNLFDRLPLSDCGDEPSFPERGKADAYCAIDASADPDQSPPRSDRAKASPVSTKTIVCIRQALSGQDASIDRPVDARERPIPPTLGTALRKRGRPRGSRNKQNLDISTRKTVAGLQAGQVRTSIGTSDNGVRFLSVKDVAKRYRLSVSSIWRLVATGQFPRPYRLTNGTTRWKIADLDAYDDALGGHYRTNAPDGISAADLADQPSAKPSQQASDGGGNRKSRRR